MFFDSESFTICDRKSGQQIVNIKMTQNKLFPLDVSNDLNRVLVAKESIKATLWHLRYGHLNVKGLKLLAIGRW